MTLLYFTLSLVDADVNLYCLYMYHEFLDSLPVEALF